MSRTKSLIFNNNNDIIWLNSVKFTFYQKITNKISYFPIFIVVLQNGYPSRRRSLVDDARFESSVVKQTKQNILDEARVKANGELCF